jgi:hypothetical protein
VSRIKELPSHLVLEEKTGWLYTIDNGNNRIFRMQTRSGTSGEEILDALEDLVEYDSIEDATVETFETGINSLCGIDIWGDRLIVTVNSTGEIRIYNTATPEPTYLGSIQAEPGIMGVKIGPDSAIWYVNHTLNTVVRLTPGELAAVASKDDAASNPISLRHTGADLYITLQRPIDELRIVNTLGQTIRLVDHPANAVHLNVSELPNGVYFCQTRENGSIAARRFVIQR